MDGDGMAPEAPQGVRVRVDSTWMPVEPIYVGVDMRGLHEWAALVIEDGDVCLVEELAADVLPANTTIGIHFEPRRAP